MIKSLKTLLDQEKQIKTFLLDAAGVIYTEGIPSDNSKKAIRKLQEVGDVFIVSNNSFINPTRINQKLLENGIDIEEDKILTSGMGLKYDKTLNNYVKDKIVYIMGKSNSHTYAIDANCKEITDNLTLADTIVLTGSPNTGGDELINKLSTHLLENPNKPIICCNPDLVVQTKTGLKTVLGHYTKQLEEKINRKAHWFGKPYENFSLMIQSVIKSKFNIQLDHTCCFFDDNIENVTELMKHAGIQGCWVKDTGIGKELNIKLSTKKYGNPTHIIPELSLNKI